MNSYKYALINLVSKIPFFWGQCANCKLFTQGGVPDWR